jgi:hypothetical protein
VKKGITAAKKFLQNNGVELCDAIKQLERQEGIDDDQLF